MNRFRLLLVATIMAAVTIFSWGIDATCADQGSAAATPATDQGFAKLRAQADAAHARAQRDAAIKRREQSKEFIQKFMDGQQPGAAATTPDNAGKENVK